jgi:hypothetical protein
VATVNRTFARRLKCNPVGEVAQTSPSPEITVEIVGLVPDTKYFDLREDFLPIAFVPIAQIPDPRSFTVFVIRWTAPPANVSSAISGAMREISPLIVTDVRPFTSTLRGFVA